MIDIEQIRNQIETVTANLAKRGVAPEKIQELAEADAKWREVSQTAEKLRARQNEANDQISRSKADEKKKLVEEMKKVAAEFKKVQGELNEAAEKRQKLWEKIPNLILEEVPIGPDASGNVVLRKNGEPKKIDFKPLPHWELGKKLGIIDSEQAAIVTGNRFAYLKGGLAQLQFALIQYALSFLTDETKIKKLIEEKDLKVKSTPFVPVIPPVMIREEVLGKMARLEPKEERYYLPADNLFLVGSAEHTLGALHLNETLKEERLPRRYVGYSTAFRREAGSHGKDVRGILRVHQFDKLEIESFTTAGSGRGEQDFIVAIQEKLMAGLELPYQVVAVCTGDMGDPDARQIDIETWMPGQDCYRETHTSDYNTDYQARRLQTRVKFKEGKKELVHMNDATVFAIGRTLIAIMENYQQADGSISVPKVLQQYLPFKKIEVEKTRQEV